MMDIFDGTIDGHTVRVEVVDSTPDTCEYAVSVIPPAGETLDTYRVSATIADLLIDTIAEAGHDVPNRVFGDWSYHYTWTPDRLTGSATLHNRD